MHPLISIIIPFHNEEQYLKRAVHSAINQSYPNVEVILIDDDSTDSSLNIASSFKDNYKNVKVLSIKGNSPGEARNTGIAHVTGEFISFLDADDELLADAITVLFNNLNKHQSDIVIGKFNRNTSKQITGWKLDGSVKTGTDTILAMYQHDIAYVVWAKLFKTEKVKQIRFHEHSWFEDRTFMLSYLLQSTRVSFVKEPVLAYQSHSDSITRKLVSKKRIVDIFGIYLLELDLIKGHHKEDELKRVIDRHEINALIETLILLHSDKDKASDIAVLKECFIAIVKTFIKQLKFNKTRMGKRDRLDLLLLQLPEMIGWKLAFQLLLFLKRKKCDSVHQLRTA